MATGELGRSDAAPARPAFARIGRKVLAGGLASIAHLARAGLVAAFALACGDVKAQDRYPSKPVRIMVSFSAGGPTDTVARVMGAKMAELLGQQFVVENKAGAGGNIGADVVAKAPPDGYTLLMATVSTHAINPGLY
jgi:tripartite-type tricarboxylate transporter receptor subunit TctC